MTERDAREMAGLIKREIARQVEASGVRVRNGRLSSASPAHVLIDGDETPVPVHVVGTAPVAGSRVAVLSSGTAHYLLGKVS